MNSNSWLYRIAVAVLVVVIVAVIGAGWLRFGLASPGLVFYLGAAVVALLVWYDFDRSREQRRSKEKPDEVETTSPDVRPGQPPFM